MPSPPVVIRRPSADVNIPVRVTAYRVAGFNALLFRAPSVHAANQEKHLAALFAPDAEGIKGGVSLANVVS